MEKIEESRRDSILSVEGGCGASEKQAPPTRGICSDHEE
jgi:hypothetical protein